MDKRYVFTKSPSHTISCAKTSLFEGVLTFSPEWRWRLFALGDGTSGFRSDDAERQISSSSPLLAVLPGSGVSVTRVVGFFFGVVLPAADGD